MDRKRKLRSPRRSQGRCGIRTLDSRYECSSSLGSRLASQPKIHRGLESARKTPYWVARDVALDVVKKAKGLRKLHKQGLSSSQAAAKLASELSPQ